MWRAVPGTKESRKLVTQRREGHDGGRARRGCRRFDGDGSSVPGLPRRCSSVHWTVTRVVGAANDRRVKKQAEMKEISSGNAQGEELVSWRDPGILERRALECSVQKPVRDTPISYALALHAIYSAAFRPRYAQGAGTATLMRSPGQTRRLRCSRRPLCAPRPALRAALLYSHASRCEAASCELRAASCLRGCTHCLCCNRPDRRGVCAWLWAARPWPLGTA